MLERILDVVIKNLEQTLLRMASLVEENIHNSIQALKQRDEKIAQQVIEKDAEIDRMEILIDEKSIQALALYQPAAIDLRIIITGMKMGTELERIGDICVNIAYRTVELAREPLLKPLIDIPKMAVLVQEMVGGSINAFVKRDSREAREVILKDDEIDNLRNAVCEEIADIVSKNGLLIYRAMPLILVARHLERMADHATNIAEDVVYLVEGRDIRHPDLKG